MAQTLFTLGYQQRDIDEYIGLLRAAQIDVLVDVRETAWSHKRGFSKAAFASALAGAGIDYIHAKFAGNPRRLRATAPSHAVCLEWYAKMIDEQVGIVDAFETLMNDLLADGKRVCITCFERHADDCHRSILADRWSRRGRRQVEHLAVDGCDRA